MSNVLLLLLPRRSTHGARVVRRPPRAGGTACCTLAKASLLCQLLPCEPCATTNHMGFLELAHPHPPNPSSSVRLELKTLEKLSLAGTRT
jgi:hypothetical protein